MMRVTRARSLLCAALALTALTAPAAAELKLQVLQSDGRADAKVRARIDAALLALARSSGEQVLPGDITFTEAAAAVGCTSDDTACKDEVLGMLSVDEIVITTVSPKPGGFEVSVRRIAKGGAAREATSFVAHDKLDKLESIAPLFSSRPAPPPPRPSPAPPAPPAAPLSTTTTPTPPPIEVSPPSSTPAPPLASQPRDPYATTAPASATAPAADRPSTSRLLPAVGIGAGATMFVVGLVFWSSAAGVQSDIDASPTSTKAQLLALQELERQGDRYATAGNLFVISGLLVGGISTYWFVKSGRRSTATARLVPAVWRGGGGLALSFGGTP